MMTNKKEIAQRRNHERFKIKNGAIAMIRPLNALERFKINNGAIAMIRPLNALGTTQKYCQIINISKDGLAFRYIDKNGGLNEPFELDLLFIRDSICFTYLKNVPLKTVWVSHEPGKTSSSHLKTRQLGVQFGKMTLQQESQLNHFLKNCTIR